MEIRSSKPEHEHQIIDRGHELRAVLCAIRKRLSSDRPGLQAELPAKSLRYFHTDQQHPANRLRTPCVIGSCETIDFKLADSLIE